MTDKKLPPVYAETAGQSTSTAGPSYSQFDDLPPPPDVEAPKYTERAFENVYIPPGGEEPPPEFAPYEAEFFISGKEIVSHDPHLNEDGECSCFIDYCNTMQHIGVGRGGRSLRLYRRGAVSFPFVAIDSPTGVPVARPRDTF